MSAPPELCDAPLIDRQLLCSCATTVFEQVLPFECRWRKVVRQSPISLTLTFDLVGGANVGCALVERQLSQVCVFCIASYPHMYTHTHSEVKHALKPSINSLQYVKRWKWPGMCCRNALLYCTVHNSRPKHDFLRLRHSYTAAPSRCAACACSDAMAVSLTAMMPVPRPHLSSAPGSTCM